MTSTVGITTSYSFSNTDGISVRGSNTYSYTLSGSGSMGNIQTFSGVSTGINVFGLPSVRHLYLANQNDVSGSLSLSLNSAQTQVFSLLGVGESIVLPSTT